MESGLQAGAQSGDDGGAKTLAVMAATNTPSLSARATQISVQTPVQTSTQTVVVIEEEAPVVDVAIEISATLQAPVAIAQQATPTAASTPNVPTGQKLEPQSPLAEPSPTDEQAESPLATPQAPEPPDSSVLTLGELLAQLIPPLQLGAEPPILAPPTRQAISLPLIIDTTERPVARPDPRALDEADFASDGAERTASVPILMYHYLSVPPADADIYRLDLSVAPDRFAAHLDAMLSEGFQAISLYDLHSHLAQGAPLPPKPVVLTFDDGYRDNYENALPLLAERGMTATFFVVTDYIDEGRPAYITWDMAREMFTAGMSIESHGRTHLSFKNREEDFLIYQSLGSSETIEFQLGTRPRFVSYPAGQYDARTIAIFDSANYWAGVTTVPGAVQSTSRPFEMPRIRVRGTTTADELIRLMSLE